MKTPTFDEFKQWLAERPRAAERARRKLIEATLELVGAVALLMCVIAIYICLL